MIFADDVSSGYAAEQFQLIIELAKTLLSLHRSGIVAETDNGLRILDIAVLERVTT